jgi:hypothetical protein
MLVAPVIELILSRLYSYIDDQEEQKRQAKAKQEALI